MPPQSPPKFPPLPSQFQTKKTNILSTLSIPEDEYTDKSPKGSIDAPIIDLIDEINRIEGLVTTSSCSGRVAVFVEGPRVGTGDQTGMERGKDDDESGGDEDGVDGAKGKKAAATGSGPGGKGGGRWLYVSHDPVVLPENDSERDGYFTRLCGLSTTSLSSTTPNTSSSPSKPESNSASVSKSSIGQAPRLIHLSFSPLILHIYAATLFHARPLLAASINSGFRESGVQSLKALDDPDAGAMVAVRTAGLSFDTVVGRVVNVPIDEDGRTEERIEMMVDEEYLKCMFGVINERFEWNVKRRERFREELRQHFGLTGGDGDGGWEDKEDRRRRKREEGLRRKEEEQRLKGDKTTNAGDEVKRSGLLDGETEQLDLNLNLNIS